MSSWIDDLKPQIAALVLDGIQDLAEFVWHKVAGDDDSKTTKDVLEAIKRKTLLAAVHALQSELEHQRNVMQTSITLNNLGPLAGDVVDAFERAAGREAPVFVEKKLPGGWIELVPSALPDDDDGA